jgi:hypothetical protein
MDYTSKDKIEMFVSKAKIRFVIPMFDDFFIDRRSLVK